jgi:DNA polymerase-4
VSDRRVIAHLDMDAFYVSVELLRRPDLRGRPVIVAGRGPRAVVTTASYEAREFGVGSAMPASQARRLCPDGVYIPPDFAHYRAKSGEVMTLIEALGVPTEPVSLDEVHLDLSALPYPVDAMTRLVRRIKDRLDLDASVGIGPNKLVAKVASDAEKPRGFVVLTREQAAARFAGESPRLRPEDRGAAEAHGGRDDRDAAALLPARPDRALRGTSRPRAARPRALPQRLGGGPEEREVAIGGDDVRLRYRRPHGA